MWKALFNSMLLAALAAGPVAADDSLVCTRLRFRGGTFAVKVNPFDWNAVLQVSEKEVVLDFGPRQIHRFALSQLREVAQGAEAATRLAAEGGTAATTPGLFGLLKPGKENLVALLYEAPGARREVVLLECDRRACAGVLRLLQDHARFNAEGRK